MVLTKAYLRYVQSACFGVVCSLKANVVFIRKRTGNSKEQVIQYAACPALESVIVWDVRRGEKASVKLSLKSSLGRDAVEPVNKDTESTIECVVIIRVSVLRGSSRKYTFLWVIQQITCT